MQHDDEEFRSQVLFRPAGRPLIPGQDATAHAEKDFAAYRWLGISLGIVFGGIAVGALLAAVFQGAWR